MAYFEKYLFMFFIILGWYRFGPNYIYTQVTCAESSVAAQKQVNSTSQLDWSYHSIIIMYE